MCATMCNFTNQKHVAELMAQTKKNKGIMKFFSCPIIREWHKENKNSFKRLEEFIHLIQTE